jgi:murein DD-endopeptidase MepM/ murein hydrolase activator NlpD
VCSSSARSLRLPIAALVLAGAVLVAGAASATPRDGGFEVYRSSVKPSETYFAGPRKPKLRFAFHSSGEQRTVVVRVVDPKSGKGYARWTRRQSQPGKLYKRPWGGAKRGGGSAPDGRYAFRISTPGGRDYPGGTFRLRNFKYPVPAPHGTRGAIGEYGAPRSGGRTHEGFDVTAPCGTPLEAIRGGRVERRGYDPRLYGHFIEVDSRSAAIDYFYAHLRAPSRAQKGDKVETGERLGEIGLTGNAAGTPCHLHIEIRASGRTVDPKPYLKRWDRYS